MISLHKTLISLCIAGLTLLLVACSQEKIPLEKSANHVVHGIQQITSARQARIRKMAETGPKHPNFTGNYAALPAAVSNKTSTISRHPFNPNDDYFGLPQTGAYELVYGYCSGCHSLRIVMQQNASEARWDYMLNWMVKTQNMPELDAQERTEILAYLAKYF